MGTSVSQHSPRTPKWKPVHVCYENENIPEEKVLNEIWRAADNPTESFRWSDELKSKIIFSCFESVQSSDNYQEAMKKFNDKIISTKSNSIAAEFAKRAIPIAFQSQNPSQEWTNRFFAEITNYIISRDTSGFVGDNYRNKTIKDLDGFKVRINNNLKQIVATEQKDIKSIKDWSTFIESTVNNLKSM